MADLRLTRRLLARASIAGWVLLGALGVALAPKSAPPEPGTAELLFGDAPSLQSSARSGTLAFARLLERLGFSVAAHHSPRPPKADVMFLLEPKASLGPEEVEALIEWTQTGGHLVYAAPVARWRDADADDNDNDNDDDWEESVEPEVDGRDALIGAVQEVGQELRNEGSVSLWRVGDGVVATLAGGAYLIGNEGLEEDGIDEQLWWLKPVLDGREDIVFDERRLGLAEGEGVFALLTHSRFWAGIRLALFALFLWLVARGLRRFPAQPLPPLGARTFSEHIDAVGHVLKISGRERLALESLAEGTRRRLGSLAKLPRARSVLESVLRTGTKPATAAVMARHAERLRRLEDRFGPDSGRPMQGSADRSDISSDRLDSQRTLERQASR